MKFPFETIDDDIKFFWQIFRDRVYRAKNYTERSLAEAECRKFEDTVIKKWQEGEEKLRQPEQPSNPHEE